MRTLIRLTLQVLKWGAICLALALVGTAVYARVLHRRDDARWHAPGRLVEVEPGRSLHIYCVGSGTPTVVLEAGAGDFGLSSWYSVLPQLSALSRTCAYDRAGTGWSDPPRVPLMPTAMVEDLHTLLAKSGEPGPYLLVGHSLGGPIIRHYAVHYPGEVAGLVLVDGSHEDQLARMKGIPSWTQLVVKAIPALHFLGIDRVVAQAQITDTMSAIVVARTTSDAAMHNTAELTNSLPAFFAEVKKDVKPFGALPLTALTAGKCQSPASRRRSPMPSTASGSRCTRRSWHARRVGGGSLPSEARTTSSVASPISWSSRSARCSIPCAPPFPLSHSR